MALPRSITVAGSPGAYPQFRSVSPLSVLGALRYARRVNDEAFVGRVEELAVLCEPVTSALDGRYPVATVVIGSPGTGKSRLLREAARCVRAAHHFEVVGHELGRQVPLSAAMPLLRPLAETREWGPDLERALFGGFRDGSDPLEPVRLFELAQACAGVAAQ